MTYRGAAPPTHSEGEELAAILELGSRAMKLRRAILLPSILLGIAAGIVGYLVVREFQFVLSGSFQFPWVSALIGGLPLFGACVRVGKLAGDRVVRLRAASWVAALEAQHRLTPGTLDEYRTVL